MSQGEHFPAVPVHDGDQKQKAFAHRDIGYVRAPSLIGSVNGHVTQQIRVAPVLRMRDAGSRLLVHRHQSHQAHESPNALSADAISEQNQIIPHLPDSQEWPLGEGPVDFLHQGQIQSRLTGFLIVQTRTGDLEQSALPDNTELRMARGDHALPAGDAHRFPQACAKKSRSTVSWPILACKVCSSFSLLTSSVLISPAKIPAADSLSCFVLLWTRVWWTQTRN